VHDPELLPAALRLKRRGKTVLYDAHEDLPLQLLGKPYLAPWARRAAALAATRYLRHACPRLDGVVAATPHIRDWFLPLQPRTIDVNNYPRLEEFTPGPAWEARPVQACYVGGLSEIRGIRELVRACELLRSPARLALAGDFSEPALAAQMRTAPGWRRVDAHGRLGREAVAALLGQSRAGLVTLHPLAHHRDALPVKLFEYMAAGIPVIASDFAGWRAIVDGARCGLCVDPLEPSAIAAAIDYLLDHPELASRMGDNGRQAVAAHYNWHTESHKLISFYEQL
jgi:glycosyltransferase involved in cell wall biosynthesis